MWGGRGNGNGKGKGDGHTDKKVAGRKVRVTIAIAFMDAPSFWVSLLIWTVVRLWPCATMLKA